MKGRYILFADDDADDLELITGFFKQYNQDVSVLEFRDGKEVMKFLENPGTHQTNPVLIVLDINMPRLNGLETLSALRKNPVFQFVPVLIYTTSSNRTNDLFCKRHNATCVIKPDHIEGVKKVAKIISDFCHLI